ncbi:MAG TPA: hypothetical protein VD995_04995 [Azospirillum sp.]|nr:hypothetical protein [Azospirillum sp.]
MTRRTPLPLLGLLCLLSGPVAAAERNPDWPCVQILVPALEPGQIWAGDPIAGKEGAWRDVPGVAPLVTMALDRSVDVERVEAEIDRFAGTLGADRNAVLTALFAGIFEGINRERGETIAAILRYARQQRALLDRVAEDLARLETLPPQSPEASEVRERIAWNRRILDDRRRYQTAVCEQPVQLEQRLGRLARAIAAHLE